MLNKGVKYLRMLRRRLKALLLEQSLDDNSLMELLSLLSECFDLSIYDLNEVDTCSEVLEKMETYVWKFQSEEARRVWMESIEGKKLLFAVSNCENFSE